MTNFESIAKNEDTLAKWLSDKIHFCGIVSCDECTACVSEDECKDVTNAELWSMWLKQPHTNKELKMTEEQVAKVFEVATEDLQQKRKATNKDWLNSMSAEDFADWLTDTFDLCGAGCSNCFVKEMCLVDNEMLPTEMIVLWLKQPHTVKE